MSRLVMNLIQYENNIPPTIVKKENRSEYIAALDLAQNKDDPNIFYNFMFKEHFDNIQKEIDNQTRRDIIQGVITHYFLNEINDRSSLKKWSEKGGLK